MTHHLWKLPKDRLTEFEAAYDIGNWLWLISIWNQYLVTDKPLCAGCPDSMETVEKGFAEWFEVVKMSKIIFINKILT